MTSKPKQQKPSKPTVERFQPPPRTPLAVNGAEKLGHWGGVIVTHLYYEQDRAGVSRPSSEAGAVGVADS